MKLKKKSSKANTKRNKMFLDEMLMFPNKKQRFDADEQPLPRESNYDA